MGVIQRSDFMDLAKRRTTEKRTRTLFFKTYKKTETKPKFERRRRAGQRTTTYLRRRGHRPIEGGDDARATVETSRTEEEARRTEEGRKCFRCWRTVT
ncbi:hypothetical protein AKJ16_DCAP16034 [Drosera capensis]